MPRGVKGSKSGVDAKIAKIDAKITDHEEKIVTLNEEKAELLAQKEAADLTELNNLLKAAGMSPAEVIASLAQK